MTISTLPTNAIKPNLYNPNRMNEDEFAELVTEVRHLGRLPKPVVVTPEDAGYTIVDGEHGWRAACEVGLETVAAEVIEADNFEARRQTYKRNQHGEHNKVLLGRMFRDMMEQRGLSRRGLADEINVSDLKVRDTLRYTDAADSYSQYARERGLDIDADNDVAALAIRQVRIFTKLPPGLARLWLAEGAGLDMLSDTPLGGDAAEAESFAGLFEFVPRETGMTFQRTLRQMMVCHSFECRLNRSTQHKR
ncbi:MAG: ParB N-terminal domain-containing protein [Proteobacteria bacterium]|nr:ParB N-terminal domain-containing protein [Pseudomonadota bacterium]